ncbi:hypothetical protein BAY61_11905 [Prauserella marina]|uniref:Htaa protein n=1 Tax=Prauserella marina TaxID=530584 RepID=A0A222VNY2_9PSEU|nr:HtaA domain-containing protein [Prauserella marina]ASR35584.1 hypothetical protein BAY61_11905 [Prauserella marina]PWV84562.1 Htaa protein [Prauserella marina]SDC19136.1 Htaa protein [Prauserella marina]
MTETGDRDEYGTGLTWGLKRSFISYVSRLPDLRHAAVDGASIVRPSLLHFEFAEYANGVAKFKGDVRIAGHGNLLYVMITDPWVEFTAEGGVLSVIDIQYWPDRDRRLPLATLRGGAPELRAFLTEEGRAVFGDQYPAGIELDPVVIRLPDPA